MQTLKDIRMLLVEDDDDDYMIVSEVVEDLLFGSVNIERETSFCGARVQLVQGMADVCLVDRRIGIDDGLDFVAEMRVSDFALPMILMTGIVTPAVEQAAMENGAIPVLQKSDLTTRSLAAALQAAGLAVVSPP